jgi:hypothetical protein
LQTLQGYIFRIFYNISQPNFAILLILVCSSGNILFLAKAQDKKISRYMRIVYCYGLRLPIFARKLYLQVLGVSTFKFP